MWPNTQETVDLVTFWRNPQYKMSFFMQRLKDIEINGSFDLGSQKFNFSGKSITVQWKHKLFITGTKAL